MLRLDKTVIRKTTLHADQDVEDVENAARWRAMTTEQRQEVLAFLRQQARFLHRLSKSPSAPDAENQ